MGDSRLRQILMFKLLQYYGPLRKSASIKFSTLMFYLIIVFSSLFSGVFVRGFYGFSDISEKELMNIISVTFSSVIAMGIFLGLKGGITSLEPEIDFVLTSPVKPSTYMLADLLFQFVFLNVAVTPPLVSFSAVMLYPDFSNLPMVFLFYELMLLTSSLIAQTLGVLKSMWNDVAVEAFGWVLLALLFTPLLGMALGFEVNYSDLPYPSTILSRYAFGYLSLWDIALGLIYLMLIVSAYFAAMRINFLPDVTPLLTTALMEMPSSNRRILRGVPRFFMQVLSPKMSEKPMALTVKLNLLRILRDGSLFTALMLFGIATLANLSFPILIRQVSFSALATLTFNILYTPLIPAIFSINWGIVERESLWATAVSEDGFKKYVKGMLIAYFVATFSFALIFYGAFNILLAGTPFIILDFLLLFSITLFASILSVAAALTLSKPSNALSLSALLYVFIPLFGALFLSMPVILARTTISIADVPPPSILLILILYTTLIAFLLSRYVLIKSKTFFDKAPAEEIVPQMPFQRNYKHYILNFSTLASLILMVVGLTGFFFGSGTDPSGRHYSLPLAVLMGLMLVASILIQRKAAGQDAKTIQNIPSKVPWRASQTILILLLALVLPSVLQFPLLTLSSSGRANDLTLLFLGEVAIIIPMLLYMVSKGISVEFIGLDSRSALQEFKLALLILPLTVLTGFFAGIVVQILVPIPPWFERIFSTISPSSFKDLVALSFFTIFFAAPCEEMLFRGFVQRGFEMSLGRNWGIVASSLLFGLFHLNPWQFLPAFLLGLILGYLFRKRSYRIWCPIALHAAYNVTLLVLSYVLSI
ncbi:MAG: type II CAAX endopeptidase family protein [Thermoproteota archaeon]